MTMFIMSCQNSECPLQLEYDEITFETSKDYKISMTENTISTPGSDNEILRNTILLFKTIEENIGKMLITEKGETENRLKFIYSLYSPD